MRRSLHLTFLLSALVAVPSASAQTLDEVIAKNLAAKGGVEKLKSTTTVRMSGVVSLSQPGAPGAQSIKMSVMAKRPNLVRQERSMDGQSMAFGFDGTTAWQSTPMGVRPLTGAQADGLKNDAEFDPLFLSYKEQGHQVELAPDETLNGRKVHHLKVRRKSGPLQHYYLDVETGLDAKIVTEGEMAGGKPLPEMLLSDYRTVDGRTVPFKLQQMVDGRVAAEITFDSIEFNVPIEDAVFRMPGK